MVHAGANEGAASARNRGIDAGTGEFVLFLDDDVRPRGGLVDAYAGAIERTSDATPGYVGVTVFPPPVNAFTRGVVASDILTFCRLPTCRPGASRSCPPSASESSPQLASRQRANGSPRRASDTQTSMFSVFFATRTRRRSTRSTSTSGSSTSCRRGCSTASFRCRRVSS